MTTIDPRTRMVCQALGMRVTAWPAHWMLPTGAQLAILRALRRSCPNAFVGAVDIETGVYRVIVMSPRGHGPGRRRPLAREYVVLEDGRMRRVHAGEPFEDETRHRSAA